jgi:hypothetical protein
MKNIVNLTRALMITALTLSLVFFGAANAVETGATGRGINNTYGVGDIPAQNFENKVELNQKINKAAWDPQRCQEANTWFLQTEAYLAKQSDILNGFQNDISDIKASIAQRLVAKTDTWLLDQELASKRNQARGTETAFINKQAEYNAKVNDVVEGNCKDLKKQLYVSPKFVF